MKSTILLVFFSLITGATEIVAQESATASFGNWTKGPSERFKGNVWVQYFVNDTISDFIASRVRFEPNARSSWHKHTGKQIIFAIEGEGYYKELGKPTLVVKKGDVIIIDPNTVHSHGSLGKHFVQGVMMNNITRPNSTTWLSPVSDEELNK